MTRVGARGGARRRVESRLGAVAGVLAKHRARSLRRLVAALRVLAVLLAIGLLRPAVAFAATSARLEASERQVGLGEPFTITLTVETSGGVDVGAPKLELPAGVELRGGPSESSQQSVELSSRGMVRKQSVSLTWVVAATKLGALRLGPATALADGERVEGRAVTVEVLRQAPPRAASRRGRGGRRDPFGMFPDPGWDPFDLLRNLPLGAGPGVPELAPAPPEAAVSEAPDDTAFVRLVVEPTDPVVGQQVRARLFAYARAGALRLSDVTKPTWRDVVTLPLAEHDSVVPASLEIAGEPWQVVELSDEAVFPLVAGELTLGGIEVTFEGGGRSRARLGALRRKAPPVVLDVKAPPTAGRPLGYRLGDVGEYHLTATVEPRAVSSGDSVAVTARLEGVGYVPPALEVPRANGVEWLPPTVTEGLGADAGRIVGWRQFVYLVRLAGPGDVDLGALRVSFWNPATERYDVASAELGRVEVGAPTAAPPVSNAEVGRRGLALLGAPRGALSAGQPEPAAWAGESWYWILVAGMPGAVVLARLGAAYAKRRRARRGDEESPRSKTRASLAVARATESPAERTRALYAAMGHALEAATGLNPRGMQRRDLPPVLESKGLPAELVEEVVAVLEELEQARFTGEGAASPEANARATKLVRRLLARGGTGR